MDNIIEKLITASDNHSEDAGGDYGTGDLQELLRQAWSIMSVSQKLQLLRTGEVYDLVEAGAREEFEVEDLVDSIDQECQTACKTFQISGVISVQKLPPWVGGCGGNVGLLTVR